MRAIDPIAIVLIGVATPAGAAVGDIHELGLTRDSSFTMTADSTGSSHDQDTLIETVIAENDSGLELEYDLPKEATPEQRAQVWQFPVRVFKRPDGSLQLLNESELQTRVVKWLKAGLWKRKVCGHYVFTWNAFRIECDPQSVLRTLQDYDIMRDFPASPVKKAGDVSATTYVTELPFDAEAVRHDRADADMVVAELSGKQLSLADALQKHAAEQISGTTTVTFEANPDGAIWRRTMVRKFQVALPGGETESTESTQILERRLRETKPAKPDTGSPPASGKPAADQAQEKAK